MSKNLVFTADVSQKSRFCSFRKHVVFSSVFNHVLDNYWATFSHNFRTFSHYIWLANFWLFFKLFDLKISSKWTPKWHQPMLEKIEKPAKAAKSMPKLSKGRFWTPFGLILGSCWCHIGIMLGLFWLQFWRLLVFIWLHLSNKYINSQTLQSGATINAQQPERSKQPAANNQP